MESVFKDFEYTIKEGLKNQMPIESKLIILGQMHYAMERGDLTIKEVEKLEELLGVGLKNYRQEMEYAVFGYVEAD
jgi:adenosine deaminase